MMKGFGKRLGDYVHRCMFAVIVCTLSAAAVAADYSGQYSGTYRSDEGDSGPVAFSVSTSSVMTVTVPGSGSGSVSSSGAATFTGGSVYSDGITCNYAGTFANGQASGGFYCTDGTTGTWQATRTGTSGGGSGSGTVITTPPPPIIIPVPTISNFSGQYTGTYISDEGDTGPVAFSVSTSNLMTVTVPGSGSGSVSSSGAATFTGGSVYSDGITCNYAGTFANGRASGGFYCNDGTTGTWQATSTSGSGSGNGAGATTTVTAIEYFHAAFGHYFITASPDEANALDTGKIQGWVKTGKTFKVYPLNTSGTSNVCRFFSTSFAPKSSHFYTPSLAECTGLKSNPNWSYEGLVFALAPTIGGTCSSSMSSLYRLYNNGKSGAPNHRYTTSSSLVTSMSAMGWVSEGTIACVPN